MANDTLEITLTQKDKNPAGQVIYDRTVGAAIELGVTNHGRFTVGASATDELHKMLDIPDVSDGKQTYAVFIPEEEISVKVGSAGAEARTVLKDVPVIIHDIADDGNYYFTTVSTTQVPVEYFVGVVEPTT